MKISIAGFPLCDGFDRGVSRRGPIGYKISESRDEQVAKGLRWRKSKVFDRGNKQTSISFSVSIPHTDIGAAEKFVSMHATVVPNNGLVQLTFFDGSSAYLVASSCQVVDSAQTGTETHHNYKIIGGEMTATKPK